MKKYSKQALQIESSANEILKEIYLLKSRVQSQIKNPNKEWNEIHVKRPRIALVKRPIRKTVIIKRPIPLPSVKKPKKKVLKKPEMKVIGPEDIP